MKKHPNQILTLLTCAGLALTVGCASDRGYQQTEYREGEYRDGSRPVKQQLQVGMTKQDVRATLGRPVGTTVNSAGQESWHYRDTEKLLIPLYSVAGGKLTHLYVHFDPDGRVQDWSSEKKGWY